MFAADLYGDWRGSCDAGAAEEVASADCFADGGVWIYGGGACFGGAAGFPVSLGFMIYLAERRRAYLIPIFVYSGIGTLLLLFASYGFRPDAFSYVFSSGAARMWLSLEPAKVFFSSMPNAGTTLAAGIALLLFLAVKRSRYFGNFAALLVAVPLLLVVTTGVQAEPWLWALPFLLTFIGGVFADALETRQRRIFLVATGGILLMQVGLCVAALPGLAQ